MREILSFGSRSPTESPPTGRGADRCVAHQCSTDPRLADFGTFRDAEECGAIFASCFASRSYENHEATIERQRCSISAKWVEHAVSRANARHRCRAWKRDVQHGRGPPASGISVAHSSLMRDARVAHRGEVADGVASHMAPLPKFLKIVRMFGFPAGRCCLS